MYKVLALGASYGSVLGAKLSLAGHDVTFVCLADEAELINCDGIHVRFPMPDGGDPQQLCSRNLPGRVNACLPGEADPAEFDLILLAMQEPQLAHPDLQALLSRIGRARVPCLSIMNMPPLPFMQRLPGIDTRGLESCYTQPSVWQDIDPQLITHSAADPQAVRTPGKPLNVLQVKLASNFKVADFPQPEAAKMLATIANSITTTSQGACSLSPGRELPVHLKVNPAQMIALSKWPMLITGNYRCITAQGIRSIEDAVHSNLTTSREIYNWVLNLCKAMGADRRILIPFGPYAKAAHKLQAPSSAARALNNGVKHIERVDKLVQMLGTSMDMRCAAVDKIVERIDQQLAANRQAA